MFMVAPSGSTKPAMPGRTLRLSSAQRREIGNVAALELVANAVISASRVPRKNHSGDLPVVRKRMPGSTTMPWNSVVANTSTIKPPTALSSATSCSATSLISRARMPSGARRMIQPMIRIISSRNSCSTTRILR